MVQVATGYLPMLVYLQERLSFISPATVGTGGVGPHEKITIQLRNLNHLCLFFTVSISVAIKKVGHTDIFSLGLHPFFEGSKESFHILPFPRCISLTLLEKAGPSITNHLIKSIEFQTFQNQTFGKLLFFGIAFGFFVHKSWAK